MIPFIENQKFHFIFFCVFGAIVGSFLNVVIFRLPRGFLLSVPRRSTCLSCFRMIPAYENIPILGFLFLRGRCRGCGAAIGARYFLVELMTAMVFGAIALNFGFNVQSIFYCFFAASLLAITFIDLDFRIIPDEISFLGLAVGLLGNWLIPGGIGISDSFLGALVGGGSFWLLATLYLKATGREGLGFGDVKLLAMIGSFLGISGVIGTIFISSIVGAAIGLTVMLVKRENMKMAIPYGPFLAIGALCMLFWGYQVTWFLFPAVVKGV